VHELIPKADNECGTFVRLTALRTAIPPGGHAVTPGRHLALIEGVMDPRFPSLWVRTILSTLFGQRRALLFGMCLSRHKGYR
jgi:hypothetical protein